MMPLYYASTCTLTSLKLCLYVGNSQQHYNMFLCTLTSIIYLKEENRLNNSPRYTLTWPKICFWAKNRQYDASRYALWLHSKYLCRLHTGSVVLLYALWLHPKFLCKLQTGSDHTILLLAKSSEILSSLWLVCSELLNGVWKLIYDIWAFCAFWLTEQAKRRNLQASYDR